MMNSNRKLCEAVGIFANLKLAAVTDIEKHFKVIKVAKDEFVFKEGDAGDFMAIVLSGKVSIRRFGAPIATMPERSVFGEISLIDGRTRSASCVAEVDTEIATLSKEGLRVLVADYPLQAAAILYSISYSLSSRLRRANDRFADSLIALNLE